jgi:hypothetical protein
LHLSINGVPGTGISDFNYGNIGMGGIFGHLRYSPEAQEYIEKLRTFDIPIIKPIDEISLDGSTEPRWGISDNSLRELMTKGILMLGPVSMRMRYTWRYIRPPSRTREERQWHELVYGNATFSDNYQKLKQLKDFDIFSINTFTGKADKFE